MTNVSDTPLIYGLAFALYEPQMEAAQGVLAEMLPVLAVQNRKAGLSSGPPVYENKRVKSLY